MSFTLPETGHTILEVYDISGSLVSSIFNAMSEECIDYKFTFDGNQLPNGLQLYRLTTTTEVHVEKWILVR